MKATTAIKNFINMPGNNPDMSYPKTSIPEIKEFKDACTPAEWKEFGIDACEVLGEPFEE